MAGNSKQYRVSSPRDYEDRNGDTKTAWVNLGVAFEKDGKITVLLNAAPFPGPDGQAKLILMEPDEDDRDGRGGGGRGRDRAVADAMIAAGARAAAGDAIRDAG